ncbi:hypothetical protein Lalb_Chr20g0112431 [Lupinus albus]|uniref:Uncharacterized protein n=1 Tax=Lupinus albus TaxID=3870 RepID=A0A6A4NJE7_LUPAL|nr:hypothetical protein Lalb_Chr20g0112431 [Lupinus albus]
MLKLISIPIFYQPIFSNTKHIVCLRYKLHSHNTAIMCKNGLMTVTKIQTPNLYIFICRASHN